MNSIIVCLGGSMSKSLRSKN